MTPLKPRKRKKLVQSVAELALTHFRAKAIYETTIEESRHGYRRPHMHYTAYASKATSLTEKSIREFCRIGKIIPEEALISVIGTKLDDLIILLNICAIAQKANTQ